MLVESLNVFLSSLTHAELARARAATETDEYRVLSEVTRTVLEKWDQGSPIGTAQEAEGATKSINPVGLVNVNFKENSISPLSGIFSSSSSEGPHSPLWPSHQGSKHTTNPNHPAEILNLDGIESGFRRHMHAMRRIREQLWQQEKNGDHITTQKSVHFPEPARSPTRTLQTTIPDSAQSSEVSSEQIDSSCGGTSSLQSSKPASVASAFQDDVRRSPSVPAAANHTRGFSGESNRKRGRSHDESQLGRTNEYMDGGARDRKPRKTALEQMLNAALFFDS